MDVLKLVYRSGSYPQGDVLGSAYASGDMYTTYAVGQASRAPKDSEARGYGLLAFRDMPSVSTFFVGQRLDYPFRLYRAEAEELIEPLPRSYALTNWPQGTIMAYQITLIEDVTDEYNARAHGVLVASPA